MHNEISVPSKSEETLTDLREDFTFLLHAAQADSAHIIKEVDPIDRTSKEIVNTYESIINEIEQIIGGNAEWTESDIARLLSHKKYINDIMRETASHAIGVTAAKSWQAPPTKNDNTLVSNIKTFVGGNLSQYKRGGFAEERAYARLFGKEYIDSTILPPQVYLTSSGMSACASTLIHLNRKAKPKDRQHLVLAGASIYFENAWLLEQLFLDSVVYVDEFDTEKILSLAKELQPSIVFFDTIAYAESLAIPDLKTIIAGLSKILHAPSTLVLDNSCMASGYQPLADMPWNINGIEIIVVESLNKFYEFGSDRVSGGVIWTTASIDNSIDIARIHAGTIIPDTSVASLPIPSRPRMNQRLLRIERNTTYAAERLDAWSSHTQGKSKIIKIIHPSLPTYPGYSWTKNMTFRGCFIALSFAPKYRSTFQYNQFMKRAIIAAKDKGVELAQGTSFGFDTTRISIAAFYSEESRHFVRLAVGTETISEIDALVDSLIAAAE